MGGEGGCGRGDRVLLGSFGERRERVAGRRAEEPQGAAISNPKNEGDVERGLSEGDVERGR